MRILVTGTTGFVGRELIRRLSGHDVVALVRPGGAGPAGVKSLNVNLSLPLDTGQLPERIDAVVHLAQSSRARVFPEGSADAFAVNVASTAALLDWAVRARASRFCLVSTGSVYEPYSSPPFREDAALAPSSLYAATKLASEVLVAPYAGHFAASVLRLFFPYGPGQKNRLIPNLAERINEGRAIDLPFSGDGLVLTPTFVDDAADVITEAIASAWSGTYNISAPQTITLHALAESIGRVIGRAPAFVRSRNAGSSQIVPDLSRMAALWNMTRFTPLDIGLKRTFAV